MTPSAAATTARATSPITQRRFTRIPLLPRRAEATAAELACIDEADEERVQGVVFSIARLAEATNGILAQRAVHHEALLQDLPPLVGEILGLQCAEADAPHERAVTVERLQGHGGHPLFEARALAVAQRRVRDPVREGQTAPGDEHTVRISQHGGLVHHVEQRLLADARVEPTGAE